MDNTTYCDPLQKIILETIAQKRGFRIDESLLEQERMSMVTVEDIEKALETEPENVDLLFARGSAYFNGDFQEAINSYSLALLQEPFSCEPPLYAGPQIRFPGSMAGSRRGFSHVHPDQS